MTAHRSHSRVSIRQIIKRRRSSSVLVLLLASILLASLLAGGLSFSRTSASAPSTSPKEKPTSPALNGQEAVDQLKQQGTYDSLQQAMTAVRYEAQWQTSPKLQGLGPAYELKNAA